MRFRIKGGWTLWRAAPVLHDLPDPGSGEGVGKTGTAPVMVEASDGIQVRVAGSVPPELSLTLIHADRLAGDERLAAGTTSRSALRSSAAVDLPTVYTRAQWGADESWRDGAPRYNSTILQAHVHHTATSNGYAQADVPGHDPEHVQATTPTAWAGPTSPTTSSSTTTARSGRAGTAGSTSRSAARTPSASTTPRPASR